ATLENFQQFSGDLASLSSAESGDIVAILQNTRDATREARDILRTIGQVVGSQQQGDFKESVKSLKTNLSKLDASLTNVQEITDKINKGQGTIGHLVNDDKLAKNLDKASTQLTNLLGTPDQIRTVNNANCAPQTCFPNYPTGVETITTERVLKFSAYLAKRYGPISGRFGILENTGGFGLKLHMANDSLNIAADLWEFANPLKDKPRLKLYADYRFLGHLLV